MAARRLIVAIDGPAGAGKSTAARLLAERLGYRRSWCYDSPAMYADPWMVLALAAACYAVRWVRAWPEMGSRYDAPQAHREPPDPARMEEADLWRAIDQGRDPTDEG